MIMQVPVIDIFAGPGGLGEGFSAAEEAVRFDIRLSVEMDGVAHQTLQLRSFLRNFGYGSFPDAYYDYIKGGSCSKEQLFELYPKQATLAASEAWKAELGKEKAANVHSRISGALQEAQHWVLLGGPPCQAYSLVGRARRTGIGAGKEKLSKKQQAEIRQEKLLNFHSDEKHTLYREYLKIVAVHKPTVFVMENVKGILSSVHADELVFEKILSDLRDPWKAIENDPDMSTDKDLLGRRPRGKPKYRLFSFTKPSFDEPDPRDFIIRAEEHGIPQRRHRVIVLGVLEEYDVQPAALKKTADVVSVRQALDSMPKLRSGLSKEKDSQAAWIKQIEKGFSPSVLGRMNKELSSVIASSLKALKEIDTRGGQHVLGRRRAADNEFNQWIVDPRLDGVVQHETRGHMGSDLWRYIFAAAYAQEKGRSPRIEDFPKRLLPQHKNVHGRKDAEVHFKDRFKVQVADDPATTITSHISKDGHYYIHYDPDQCRSLTVREAARLQTFPDNYFFEGNRTQQYHQIGNAVPPLLARKLAAIVSGIIEQCRAIDRTKKSVHMSSAREKKKARA